MPFRILPTKLYPPDPPARAILRPALFERLGSKATIVCAPPGFGKSTLLSTWLATQAGIKSAWFSVDEDDNEPARFWRYVLAALRPHAPLAVQPAESLLEGFTPSSRDVVISLLNGWDADLSDIALILDDYHHIQSQAIHDALAYLIDHRPPNLHIVMISRVDPPLPLGRWRVRGQLAEIRAEDLRFTETEAAQFLNQAMGLNLSPADIHTLESRTEGWVAGLQLASLSLQRAANPTEVIASFAGSHRYIADFLTDEVLERQPEVVRRFLLQTSILERFNAALCDHLLGVSESEAMLSELERANLFVIPLDAQSYWFRYHHLFAELLRRRLAQSFPGQVSALHRRAAEWFEENELLFDAIRHWVAAGETARVAALIESAISKAWGRAEHASLMRYVEALPEPVLAEYPNLSAFLGWTWFWLGHDSDRIRPLLDLAEKRASIPLLGRFNIIRSFLARISDNDAPRSLELGQQALGQLASDDVLWRGFANLSIAISTHSSGRSLVEVDNAYSETIRLCQSAGDYTTAWIASCGQVQSVMERGDLGLAIALNRQLLEIIAEKGAANLVRGWTHINQAWLMYQINDLETARCETELTLKLEAQTGGIPDVGLRLHALMIKLALIDTDEIAARKAADELITLSRRTGIKNALDWASACQAHLMLRLGDWPAFEAWVRTYQPPQQPLFFPYRLATLLYARYLIHQKAWTAGRQVLLEQAKLAHEAGYCEYEMEIDIVRAILEKEAGNITDSIHALARALKIGAAGGYVRVFVDEGEPLKSILAQAQKTLKDAGLVRYCTQLLAAFEPGAMQKPDQQTLIEPLTGREIEVLQLVADGLSNPEIGARLFLSLGTVKTHVKHIYRKLGVDDRVKAASKGLALGLIETGRD